MGNVICIPPNEDDKSKANEESVSQYLDGLTEQLGSDETSREEAEKTVNDNLFAYVLRWAKKLGDKFIESIIYLWCAMTDPEVPIEAKLTAIAALVYFISPIDLIPDFLPGGLVDDGAALAAAVAAIAVILVKHGTNLNVEQKKKEFYDKLAQKKS